MLRITPSRSAAAAKAYYTEALAKQDYLSEGQQVQGRVYGRLGEMLGLCPHGAWSDLNEARGRDFAFLSDNKHPITKKQLTARMKKDRRVGYDFTTSTPKGLSLLYGLTGDDRIKAAHEWANREMLKAMEKDMNARVRKDGAFHDRRTGNFVCMSFPHEEARETLVRLHNGAEVYAPCPHLHSHNFIFNVTWDLVEKVMKAGEFAGLHLDRPYYEAMYETLLAIKLRELGFEIERRGKGWDIAGLPESLLKKFSPRTAQVETEAERRGVTDEKRKAELGGKTRRKKTGALDMDQLRIIWRDMMSPSEINAVADVLERSRIKNQRISAKDQDKVHESIVYSIAKSFEKNSVVDSRKLMEEAMRFGVGYVSPEDAQSYRNMAGVMAVEQGERTLVTTREVLAEEKRMLDMARDGRGQCMPLGKRVYRSLMLNKGQAAAVNHALSSMGSDHGHPGLCRDGQNDGNQRSRRRDRSTDRH